MKRVFFTPVLLFVFVALSSALYSDPRVPCPPNAPGCPKAWSYRNATQWSAQCPKWAKCSNGAHQSPIDVTSQPMWNGWKPKDLHIKYSFLRSGSYIFNTGNYYLIPVNPSESANTFDYNGDRYYLTRIEFHSPSQHLLNGKRFDLEAQLFHTGATSSKTVAFSVFFSRSSKEHTNPFIEDWVYNVPEKCSCEDSSCPAPVCGNGILEGGEACDDGEDNSNEPGACRESCCLPYCGDDITDWSEECDDGNNQNGDGCNSICKSECGNGELNAGEQCDWGVRNNDTAPNSCRTDCKLPICGDNVRDNREGCDSFPFGVNPGQCRVNCTAPRCGDGITDPNEECDYAGENADNFYCQKNCSCACGNGAREIGEDCDLGGNSNNQNPNTACRGACYARRCGDGIIDDQFGEECDSIYFEDNVPVPNIYCTADCKIRCGNDIVETGEECDDGIYNGEGNSKCLADCTLAKCGDGIVHPGEECDDGNDNSDSAPNACRTDCKLPHCGDEVTDRGEECDSTPGCSISCLSLCGNGFLDDGEECDFGSENSNKPDSCRPHCSLPRCGDGIKDTLEECDQGNNGARDGTCRSDCTLPYCGDGVVDASMGEQCDNGKENDETDPFGCGPNCLPNACISRSLRSDVSLTEALPCNRTAYTYAGSWTHPPCDEVQWIIFGEVQEMTTAQYYAVANHGHCKLSGPRPLQPLNGRGIGMLAESSGPVCGNGVQESEEECDSGLRNSDQQANRCRTSCQNPHCGDGVTDRGEECDDGKRGSHRCNDDCTLVPVRTNPFAAPSWSYANACKWSMFNSEWKTCSSDRHSATQSPINIDTEALHRAGKGVFSLSYRYSSAQGTLHNTGRVIAFNTAGTGNVLAQSGKSYYLKRVEFHSPSEHTLNGYHADLEAVFLHSSDDGAQAAVSVLYNQTDVANEFLDQFWFSIPQSAHCECGNGVVDRNEECDDGEANSDTSSGACRTNCKLAHCGDGVVDRGEECDEAVEENHPDSCRSDCSLPSCGDGIVDPEHGEECDFANNQGAPCDKTCHLLCGNGHTDAGEQCDEGKANSNEMTRTCNLDCTEPRCGDGVLDTISEECDEGEHNSDSHGSFCHLNCKKPRCGDDVTDLGEECDNGASNGLNNECLETCVRNCGSGVTSSIKECDLGSANSNADGAQCRTNCELGGCGDNIIDFSKGEECDDGPSGSQSCSTTCKLLCGNGVTDAGEECDDGALNDDLLPNSCRTNCMAPSCGDGVRDMDEECDFGSRNSNFRSECTLKCKWSKCGDGFFNFVFEECDDGNNKSGDGCSSTCKRECGNGRKDGDEVCDDGELNGSPNACRFDCSARPTCGDGLLDDGEECDDGVRTASPNACRPGCTLPVCGDGITDTHFGEECDNGEANDDFTGECSSDCKRNCGVRASETVSFENALSRTSPVIAYTGSLTAPPCTEGVSVYVFEHVQPLSEHQLAHFRTALGGPNARGVQPTNGRRVAYTRVAPTTCGDCQVQGSEECDNGINNGNGKDQCRPDCKRATCGDGITDSGEDCDEGEANNDNGSCSRNCRHVPAPRCSSEPEKKCPCEQEEQRNKSGNVINIKFANILRGVGCPAEGHSD